MKKDIKNLLHVNKCNYHGIIIIKMKGAIMNSFETEHMPLHEKFHNFCVELSTHLVLGGGAF